MNNRDTIKTFTSPSKAMTCAREKRRKLRSIPVPI